MTLPGNIKRSLGNKEFGIQPYRTAKNYAGTMRKPTEASVGFVTIREEKGRPTELWRPYVGDQGYQLQRYEVTPPPGEPALDAQMDVGYDLEAYEAGEGFAEYWVPGEEPIEIFQPGALPASYTGRFTEIITFAYVRLRANPFFKPDGYELYVGDGVGQTVIQWTLGTAWDLSTATYTDAVNVSGQIGSEDLDTIFFSSDGTKMYAGDGSVTTIYQYTLASAWDISTASYASKSFDYYGDGGGWEMENIGMFIGDSGTKLFVCGYIASSGVSRAQQFNLSTAWDISTAQYPGGSRYFTTSNRPNAIFLNSAGSKVYITRYSNEQLIEYTLGTNWDFATETLNDTYDYSAEFFPPDVCAGMFYKPDGTKLYLLNWNNDTLFQYSSNVAWDIDLTYDTVSKSLQPVGDAANPSGIFLNFRQPFDPWPEPRNQFRVWVVDPVSALIICHQMDAFLPWTNYVNDVDVNAQETNVRGIFFEPLGLKAYVVGLTNATIYQYILTTRWDVDTMSYDSKFFDVSAYDIEPMELFFRPDGYQVYMVGFDTSTIYRFELSTAWDISTASFSDNYLNVSAQDEGPAGMFITADGQVLYVSGVNNNLIHKYILDTPGDLGTGRYTGNYYDVTDLVGDPRGIFFDDETGTYLYVADWDAAKVYAFNV